MRDCFFLNVASYRKKSYLAISDRGGREDVPRKTHGDPFLAIHLETIDLRVVHLVVFRFGGGEQLRDLLRGDVFLCDDELHVGTPCRPVDTSNQPPRSVPRGGGFLPDSITKLREREKSTHVAARRASLHREEHHRDDEGKTGDIGRRKDRPQKDCARDGRRHRLDRADEACTHGTDVLHALHI